MVKQVTVYKDFNGGLHEDKENAVREDAYIRIKDFMGNVEMSGEAIELILDNADYFVGALKPMLEFIVREEARED